MIDENPCEEKAPGLWSASVQEKVNYVQLIKNYFLLFGISVFISALGWGVVKIQQLVPWDGVVETGRAAADTQVYKFSSLVLTIFLTVTGMFALPLYTMVRFVATNGRDAARKSLIYSVLVWVMIGLGIYFFSLWAFGMLLTNYH